ncbi:aminotransferase class IV [Micromonosporaceae bacterium Da 78-11]
MTDRLLVSAAELFGDGVFETLHLRPPGPWLLDEHLDRLARSAAQLDLTPPPRAALADRIAEVTAGRRDDEAALRIICTRESTHVTVSAIAESVRRERRHGIRLISADSGQALDRRPPWSLSAAKTLSYASNFAAKRWAARQGADDLLWLSTEGYALEGPTASLVWLAGDALCTVPAGRTGILPGTTAAHLLSLAPTVGLRAEERLVTPAELADADAIWLASALRGLAQAVSFDGTPRPASRWTARFHDLLGFV